MAVQISAGEVQLAGMSWVLVLGLVYFSPFGISVGRRMARMLGLMALGLAGAVILSLPQIALAWELAPVSIRAGGLRLEGAAIWPLLPSQLGSLLIPNYLLSTASHIY